MDEPGRDHQPGVHLQGGTYTHPLSWTAVHCASLEPADSIKSYRDKLHHYLKVKTVEQTTD